MLFAGLAESYLKRLAHVRYNLFDTRWSAVRPRLIRLITDDWRGRY